MMKGLASLAIASTFISSAPAVFADGGRELSDTRACERGRARCVDKVIRRMTRRFDRLARRCDHDAIFAVVYLRTTEVFRQTLPTVGYEDASSVIREDALFADYYFRAFDGYHRGTDDVPAAWQIAFDAAEERSVSALGNSLLGFNAHINRDLPFTLYDLYRQGTAVSETDHFLVDNFLAQVDVAQELIDRFDPTYPPVGDSSFIFAWRQAAWDNYQRLVNAKTEQDLAAVTAEIETNAANLALILLATTALPPGQDSSARDAYCRANRASRTH